MLMYLGGLAIIATEASVAPASAGGISMLFTLLGILPIIVIIVIAVVLLAKNKSKNSKAEKICPQCGKIVGTDKKFCMNCGAEVK